MDLLWLDLAASGDLGSHMAKAGSVCCSQWSCVSHTSEFHNVQEYTSTVFRNSVCCNNALVALESFHLACRLDALTVRVLTFPMPTIAGAYACILTADA